MGLARTPRSNGSSLSPETELDAAAQGRGLDPPVLHAARLRGGWKEPPLLVGKTVPIVNTVSGGTGLSHMLARSRCSREL